MSLDSLIYSTLLERGSLVCNSDFTNRTVRKNSIVWAVCSCLFLPHLARKLLYCSSAGCRELCPCALTLNAANKLWYFRLWNCLWCILRYPVVYRFFGAIHIRSSKHDHVQAMLRKDGTIDVYGGTVLVSWCLQQYMGKEGDASEMTSKRTVSDDHTGLTIIMPKNKLIVLQNFTFHLY